MKKIETEEQAKEILSEGGFIEYTSTYYLVGDFIIEECGESWVAGKRKTHKDDFNYKELIGMGYRY